MEGGEGWRMLRCDGGAQDMSNNATVMNQIMLRFRPIAPKPVTGDGVSATANRNLLLTTGRTKRKYVRVRKNNSGYAKKNTEEISKVDGLDLNKRVETTTLQLLPENCDIDHISTDGGSWRGFDRTVSDKSPVQEDEGLPMWLNHNKLAGNYTGVDGMSDDSDLAVWMRAVEYSRVTVECVTGTCMGVVQGFGSTDDERMRTLEGDTCPGFISDGLDRVQWLNGAFRRMVSQQNQNDWQGGQRSEIAVWLLMKEMLPYDYSVFTCQVKLQYIVGKEKYSQMVPCDLWRMDGGGFAWRLDVKAALTLGRSDQYQEYI